MLQRTLERASVRRRGKVKLGDVPSVHRRVCARTAKREVVQSGLARRERREVRHRRLIHRKLCTVHDSGGHALVRAEVEPDNPSTLRAVAARHHDIAAPAPSSRRRSATVSDLQL